MHGYSPTRENPIDGSGSAEPRNPGGEERGEKRKTVTIVSTWKLRKFSTLLEAILKERQNSKIAEMDISTQTSHLEDMGSRIECLNSKISAIDRSMQISQLEDKGRSIEHLNSKISLVERSTQTSYMKDARRSVATQTHKEEMRLSHAISIERC